MPPERTPQSEAPPEPDQAFVLPEEIEDETFQELLAPGSGTLETPVVEDEPADRSPNPPVLTPMSQPTSTPAGMEQVLAALPGAIAQGVAAALKSGKTDTPDMAQSITNRLKASNPGMDEGQAKWLTDTVGAVLEEHRKTDQERIGRLEQALISTVQNQTAGQFMSFLDQQMDRLGIPKTDAQGEEAWERTALRDHTIQACLKLGAQVTPEHAVRILKTINDRRLRTAIVEDPQYLQDKQKQEEDAPPVRHARSGVSASEGIRKALHDPKNKRMGFRGQDFQRLVTESINASRKAAGKLLGGRKT